jgi:hypothetical protein
MEEIATREEILLLLSAAARSGHVGAMRLLLDEFRRDDDVLPTPGIIDELANKRKKASIV